MNLFSIFRSTYADLLFSKRIVTILYFILSIAVMSEMVSAIVQISTTYLTLHQFDLSPGNTNFVTLCFFLPYWIVGALMLRACAQRIRLAAWIRQATRIAEYDTPLSPAEAGFLADYTYSKRELVATLVDLQLKGFIRLIIDPVSDQVTIQPQPAQEDNLSMYEHVLLQSIMSSGRNTFSSLEDPRLLAATYRAQGALLDDLVDRQLLRRERLPNKTLGICFRVIYVVAGIVGLTSLYAYIFQHAQVVNIGYPRYPLYLSEVLYVFAAAAIALAICVSGLVWPRFANNPNDSKYEAWIDAAGFMLYMRTVFSERFKENEIASQDVPTLRKYVPYAIAFGLIPIRLLRITQVLELVSGNETVARAEV